jgi:hypothetical protein
VITNSSKCTGTQIANVFYAKIVLYKIAVCTFGFGFSFGFGIALVLL